MSRLLDLTGLTVRFPTRFGEFTAIEDINLHVNAGEIHGLVGESGAGKSTIGAAIMGLLQHPGYRAAGRIVLNGDELTALDERRYHRLRGQRISMIFQDPQTSLNPLLTVAAQLTETICQHTALDQRAARERAIEILRSVGLEDAEQRMDEYPHQFSGGMRQRVVIALALCTEPELIIADEPTTALDVSVQKQILALLRKLADDLAVGFLLITHDIGIIAEITDRVTVLQHGRVVESGITTQVLGTPQHPYTRALMAAVPRLDLRLPRFKNIVTEDAKIDGDEAWSVSGASASYASDWLLSDSQKYCGKNSPTAAQAEPVLQLNNINVTFHSARPRWFGKDNGFQALSGVSLELMPGEVLGVVGESGSGKSTLAKAVVGLIDPSAGEMRFNGTPLAAGSSRSRRHISRHRGRR